MSSDTETRRRLEALRVQLLDRLATIEGHMRAELPNTAKRLLRQLMDDVAALPAAPPPTEDAHAYLSRLLTSCAPQCEPLPDLMGLCSQIDNLLTGLRAAPPSVALLKYVNHLSGCPALLCPLDGAGRDAGRQCSCGLDAALAALPAAPPLALDSPVEVAGAFIIGGKRLIVTTDAELLSAVKTKLRESPIGEVQIGPVGWVFADRPDLVALVREWQAKRRGEALDPVKDSVEFRQRLTAFTDVDNRLAAYPLAEDTEAALPELVTRAQLRSIEWWADSCPACRGHRFAPPRFGHLADCWLAAALAEDTDGGGA